MRTRIREIRKAKGLTLADVAARIKPEPSTAQTIGRLETGRRKVSVDWLNKLAAALGVDPSELITLPAPPDCPLVALLGGGGVARPAYAEMIDLRLTARDPVAMRVESAGAAYRPGDEIIFDREAPEKLGQLVGLDILLETTDRQLLFGRLIDEADGSYSLAANGGTPVVHRRLKPLWAGRPVLLLRSL